MPLFITGSDTNVGKTVVTALLAAEAQAQGKTVCVYKPIQTGSASLDQPEDLVQINQWLAEPVDGINTYNFLAPVAPYVADTERTIRPAVIQQTFGELLKHYDEVLVEGAGGVRVPIALNYEMIDLIRELGLPAVVVVRPDLGTLNHTLLTVEALTACGVKVQAVVISGYPENSPDLAIRSLPDVLDRFLPTVQKIYLPLIRLESMGEAAHPARRLGLGCNIL